MDVLCPIRSSSAGRARPLERNVPDLVPWQVVTHRSGGTGSHPWLCHIGLGPLVCFRALDAAVRRPVVLRQECRRGSPRVGKPAPAGAGCSLQRARLRSGRKAGCCEQWAGEARRQAARCWRHGSPLGGRPPAKGKQGGQTKGGLQGCEKGRTGLPTRSATRVEVTLVASAGERTFVLEEPHMMSRTQFNSRRLLRQVGS